MANGSQRSGASIKQEREAQRNEKVEAFKRQRAIEKRNRRIGIISAIVGGVAVITLLVFVIVSSFKPPVDPESISIEGLEKFTVQGGNHVNGAVDYEALYGMTPPAGGDHAQPWLNCGIYDQPVPNERAVHALEHGAVWVTYDPEVVTGGELDSLRSKLPSTYIVLSPFPGLPSPVVASAWGNQVQLDGADDERLGDFIDKFWKAGDAPEIGAACSGQPDEPGLVG
jgi:hypothetical protein